VGKTKFEAKKFEAVVPKGPVALGLYTAPRTVKLWLQKMFFTSVANKCKKEKYRYGELLEWDTTQRKE